jgi:hypothetical protein
MVTLRDDITDITEILKETFNTQPFQRNYDQSFGKIADIINKYGITENPRNLRFRFILCMQEFFDSIPQEQWRVKDPSFIKESEEFGIQKFKHWILEQIT